VFIIDSNPFMTGSEFHPDAIHRINIDNDNDLHADIAFTFTFSEPQDGAQTVTAHYATGSDARHPEPAGTVLVAATPVGWDSSAQPVQAGRCRLFVGVRSDPFFVDAEGFLHGFEWTGQDTFAGKNVLSIALEVPNDMLGNAAEIGVWATISVRQDGRLVQMDRGGHPSMNPIVNTEDVQDGYNLGEPATDAGNYLDMWSHKLQESGGYSPAEATALAGTVIPDILRYDRTKPASYPNGRVLTDNVWDARIQFLTNGKVGSAGLKPHDDYLVEFPFVGPPNP
jgi:hypothetical protein